MSNSDKIEELREILHKLLNSEEKDTERILQVSQELDSHIVNHYKEKDENDK